MSYGTLNEDLNFLRPLVSSVLIWSQLQSCLCRTWIFVIQFARLLR